MKKSFVRVNVTNYASTAEAAELFDVTRKTIALWAQQGVMVKLRHGVFDLKASLQNWTAYQRCIHEGYDDPLYIWQLRQEVAWREANPLPPLDLENTVLVPISDLEMQSFEVELDAAGKVVRARAIT